MEIRTPLAEGAGLGAGLRGALADALAAWAEEVAKRVNAQHRTAGIYAAVDQQSEEWPIVVVADKGDQPLLTLGAAVDMAAKKVVLTVTRVDGMPREVESQRMGLVMALPGRAAAMLGAAIPDVMGAKG